MYILEQCRKIIQEFLQYCNFNNEKKLLNTVARVVLESRMIRYWLLPYIS